jgi:hypothetical protein
MRRDQAWDLLGEGVAGQAGWWQKNRRIRSRISTCSPPMAASASVRWQRLWTLAEG